MNEPIPIIEMRDISKSFGGVHALKGVQLTIYPGEVHAILGENGAGKSTLIKTITGVHQPDSGEIELNGEVVNFANPREAQQQGIAAIYQEPSLFPDLSIAENILVGRQPVSGGRISWRQMNQIATDLLARLHVKLNPRTKARSLSVAQQQMVEIARALSVDAKVLIMDEPTRGIDVGTKAAVHRLMSSLAAEGMAILMISSELPEILGMSDRILVIREGHITGEFERGNATQETLMMAATGAG